MNQLNIIELKTAIAHAGLRTVEPEEHEKSAVRISRKPVRFEPAWCSRAEVNINRAVRILFQARCVGIDTAFLNVADRIQPCRERLDGLVVVSV